MRISSGNPKLKFYIGDVRNYDSVQQAMKGVDYVFHAAALKQVPSCEFYPMEAVRTNVLGTQNVLDAATANGVKRVIVLSTDKAVYPINAMGMSKGLAEKVAISRHYSNSNTQTVCNCTRYGNVLASRGSVLPLFIDQIVKDREVTITDPEMTRFLMSLDQSVGLVEHAFNNNETGKLYVKKSPAADIETLYNAVREILGAKSRFKVIGPRHGEKKHETLVSAEEMLRSDDQGEFYCISTDTRTLNYSNYTSSDVMTDSTGWTDYNSANTQRLSLNETISLLQNNREFCELLAKL